MEKKKISIDSAGEHDFSRWGTQTQINARRPRPGCCCCNIVIPVPAIVVASLLQIEFVVASSVCLSVCLFLCGQVRGPQQLPEGSLSQRACQHEPAMWPGTT